MGATSSCVCGDEREGDLGAVMRYHPGIHGDSGAMMTWKPAQDLGDSKQVATDRQQKAEQQPAATERQHRPLSVGELGRSAPSYESEPQPVLLSGSLDSLGPPPTDKFLRPAPKVTPRLPPSARRHHTPQEKAVLNGLIGALMKDPPDRAEVERAMAAGRAAGLRPAELKEAREEGLRAAARQRARDALKKAVLSKDEEALRSAVILADEVFLDLREMEEALSLVEEIEAKAMTEEGASPKALKRTAVVDRLRTAIASRDFDQLTEAIRDAERAGLAIRSQRALLAEARMTLKIVWARRQAFARHGANPDDESSPRPAPPPGGVARKSLACKVNAPR